MGTFKVGSVELGEEVYKTESGRFILAPNQQVALDIVKQLRLTDKSVEFYVKLNDANVLTHRLGSTVTAHKSGELITMDTVLVFGSPRGLDTTRPNKVVYKR